MWEKLNMDSAQLHPAIGLESETRALHTHIPVSASAANMVAARHAAQAIASHPACQEGYTARAKVSRTLLLSEHLCTIFN